MKGNPIYVELDIAADMESLWRHTQEPALHQQWDLRFTEINYLPKEAEGQPQRFLYRTRIGFGLHIQGTGEARTPPWSTSGQRMSTLVFGSAQPISLISQGGGYWRYKPNGAGVTFSTSFHYETRFGKLGRLLDGLLFRPFFGYATAWSFDRLRLWLERGLTPAVSLKLAAVHYMSVAAITMLWLFEGLVPKLLYPEGGELAIYSATGLFPGAEEILLPALGITELAAGAAVLIWHRKLIVYAVSLGLLILLGAAACIGAPELLASPFNPLTTSMPMAVLCLIAAMTADGVPSARRCRRRLREESGQRGGGHDAIDL
ncbi:DoxX-like family protein [Paenibacillus sp. PL2-23]|uniref:DoxX-like family protein n=1 Tax=Paenibacillus sp. PL2-23 TaxID=2100729 RepID=UPI0030FAD50F